MGYQIIEASKYGTSNINKYVVYNSEIAISLDSNFLSNKTKLFSNRVIMSLENGQNKFKAVSTLDTLMLETKSINVLNKRQAPVLKFFSAFEKTKNKRHSGTTGAIDSKIEYANGQEVFVRLSAFADDKRINFIEKKLKEGSYSTTEQDYKDCVLEKDNPVDRYALPNDEEIKWSYYIKPKTTDTLQRGVVQPAFDHSGGGIECYFANGTSKDTYLEIREYGK
jgi:hypothetical protein